MPLPKPIDRRHRHHQHTRPLQHGRARLSCWKIAFLAPHHETQTASKPAPVRTDASADAGDAATSASHYATARNRSRRPRRHRAHMGLTENHLPSTEALHTAATDARQCAARQHGTAPRAHPKSSRVATRPKSRHGHGGRNASVPTTCLARDTHCKATHHASCERHSPQLAPAAPHHRAVGPSG